MADPVSGEVFDIEVQTAVGPPIVFTNIAEVTSYDRNTARSSNSTRVFGRATPRLSVGSRDITYTIAALLSPEDPGQVALFNAESAGTPIEIRVFLSGTAAGFTQAVKVTSKRHGARADGDWQEVTFDLTADADAVVVGGGVIV